MAKELDAIIDHGEANPAPSCITESGSVSFLEQIICPIYDTMALVSLFFTFYPLFFSDCIYVCVAYIPDYESRL